MRTFEQIICAHATSEPGDLTRYDFAMYKQGDEISIMPLDNNFFYPQKLNFWAVAAIIEHKDSDLIQEVSERFNCSPHTLLEVCATIMDYYGDKS